MQNFKAQQEVFRARAEHNRAIAVPVSVHPFAIELPAPLHTPPSHPPPVELEGEVKVPAFNPPLQKNKPLPFRRQMTDDRGVLRVMNPDPVSDSVSQSDSVVELDASHGRVEQATAVRAPLLTTPEKRQITREPFPPQPRYHIQQDELFLHVPEVATQRHELDVAQRVQVPLSLRPGKKTNPHQSPQGEGEDEDRPSHHSHIVSLPAIRPTSLLRTTIPSIIRPSSPPLRWDFSPAPQIPPLSVDGTASRLRDDDEVAVFITAGVDRLREFARGDMPVAGGIVRGVGWI